MTQAERIHAMFGTTIEDIEAAVKAADWRHEADPQRSYNGIKSLILTILSDAQELIELGSPEQKNRARQKINVAKYITDKHL
jgi:hypothetical protein